MKEIPYTQKQLLLCFGYKDVVADKSMLSMASRLTAVRGSIEKIEKNTIFQNSLRSVLVAGKQAYVFSSLQAELVARLVTKNIKANYRVRQSDRNTVVKNALSLLKEGGPYDVYRFDIKNFYENVDRKLIFEKLLNDAKCSWQTLCLINDLFEYFEILDVKGLPRGLGVSAALSELALIEFDEKIKHKPEIFYYGRVVDDIMMITHEGLICAEFEKRLSDDLLEGLEFHDGSKKNYLAIARSRKEYSSDKYQSFDFLGYEFQIFNHNESSVKCRYGRRKLKVDISTSKVEKIKARLINSFCSYIASSRSVLDFSLLRKRVMALTGNYYISDPISGIQIKTGVYYNYHEKNFTHECSLKKLDAFLHGLLFSGSHALSGRIITAISVQQRRQLAGYSFLSGFRDIRFHSFTYQELKVIKECWRK